MKAGEATSKKNPIVRRTEVFLRTIDWLLPVITRQLALISHPLACKVIFETLMHAYSVSDPSYATAEGKDVRPEDINALLELRPPLVKTVEALAKMLSDEGNLSLVEDSNIHHHLKRLFTKTQPSGKGLAEAFSKAFLPLVSQPALPAAWLSNRGAFLLVTILESDELLKVSLKAHIGEIKQAPSAGAKLLTQVLEETAAERTQRLATHKDEVAQSDAPTKALKKKKKKPKKRPIVSEGANHGEYKDAAIVGMKPKASKSVRILSLATADKESKKALSKEETTEPVQNKKTKAKEKIEPAAKKPKGNEVQILRSKSAQDDQKVQQTPPTQGSLGNDEGDEYEGDGYEFEGDEGEDAY